MSVMANQTLQETGETIEPVTFSLGFYAERMKFIICPLRCDAFIIGNNWKNKQKATIDRSNNHVHFNHAGHKYIIYSNETITKTSLGSLVNDYRNGFLCFLFCFLMKMIIIVIV